VLHFLSRQFAYLLRLAAIHFALFLIMAGAAVLGSIVLPLQSFIRKRQCTADARDAVSRGVRLYLSLLQRSGLIELQVKGLSEQYRSLPAVIVANHPSLLDALFFFALFPRCTCIVKKSLFVFSPYSFVIAQAGYIVSAADRNVVEEAKEELQAGHSVIIFPQGTRSGRDSADFAGEDEGGKLDGSELRAGKFKRGAAAIALRSGAPIIPVYIACDPPVLGREQRWYEIPQRTCLISLEFDRPRTVQVDAGETLSMAARRVTADLEKFFADWETRHEQQKTERR
jgi:1-acyl-sn-glycerol-3-phosphate acyltransferase